MSEEGLAQSRYESESATSYGPDWKEIAWKFIVTILFFLSSIYFAVTLSDIQGFIEDRGFGFKYIEFFIILSSLVIFYVGSKIVFCAYSYSYNKIFPQKKCEINGLFQLIIGVLIFLLYRELVLIFLVPELATGNGAESKILCKTMASWLLSILFMTVLLNSSRFEKEINKFAYKIILRFARHKSNRRNVNE